MATNEISFPVDGCKVVSSESATKRRDLRDGESRAPPLRGVHVASELFSVRSPIWNLLSLNVCAPKPPL